MANPAIDPLKCLKKKGLNFIFWLCLAIRRLQTWSRSPRPIELHPDMKAIAGFQELGLKSDQLHVWVTVLQWYCWALYHHLHVFSMSSLFTITSTYHPTGKFLWALASPASICFIFILKILYLVLANTMPSTEVWWRKVLIWSLLIHIFSSLLSHVSNVLIKCFTQCDFISHHPGIVSRMRKGERKKRGRTKRTRVWHSLSYSRDFST